MLSLKQLPLIKTATNYLFVVILTFAIGCDNNNNQVVTMKDGTNICISSTIKYYNSINSFLEDVKYPFPCHYSISNISDINYDIDKTYSVNGINEYFIGCWEMAKFGNWISEYGLNPNEIYFTATKVYTKYVNKPDKGLRIVPCIDMDNMGFSPGINKKTFIIISDNLTNALIFCTGCRIIGYDKSRNIINQEIPNIQNITWKFLVTNDGWEK